MVKAFLLRAWASLHIAVKRLLAQWGLALLTTLGLTIAISLVLSIPLYADAVNHRIFLENVATNTGSVDADKPVELPLTFLFYYYGGWNGSLQWEGIQPFDQFVAQSASTGRILDMPVKSVVRYISTDSAYLYSASAQQTTYKNPSASLGTVSFAFMDGLEGHITLDEGAFPGPAEPQNDSPIEVLVSLPLANKLGVQVGENYAVQINEITATGSEVNLLFPVEIAGIWEPKDSSDPYWVSGTSNLIDELFVPEQTFVNRISPVMTGEVFTANWYITLDGTNISSSDVATLLGRIGRMENMAGSLLPNIRLLRSPENALVAYHQAVNKLTILLYAFSVPILGLILAFIALVSSLMIERKRNEMAVTRSRGANAPQVLGSIALESGLLGLAALAIGIPAAVFLTKLIGHTRSFMDFSNRAYLRVNLTPGAWEAGLIAVAVALLTALIPAITAIRYTIVSYKLERARQVRTSWWQRLWLDVLLLVPVWYGMYLMKKQGGILAIGSNDPLGNPFLFLIPSLAVLACTLILLRLIPPLMSAIAWLAARTKMVGLLLASRQLARSPGHYNTPFLILVFTLSLSAYTASLAQTLDQHLYAKTYYQIGADVRFTEVGEQNPSPFPTPNSFSLRPEFFSFPPTEYMKIPGIQAVARVGRYPARSATSTGGSQVIGIFYGIDRVDFPKVAYWRRDFASEDLGSLMNALAAAPNAILVPANMGLGKGSPIKLTVTTDIGSVVLDATVAGTFNLFPSWYQEKDGPLFVGNLDTLFDQAGGESPYQVWAKAAPDMDYSLIRDFSLPDLNIRVIGWDATLPRILQVQQRPEQQGIFGFLFIGFAAAAILTVVGFLLYALFSYQRRFVELGVLRAGGLSRGQMGTYLAFELIFLVLFGGAAGTTLGIWMSNRFIPYLQIGTDVASRITPFRILIDWTSVLEIYGLFVVLFIVTWIILVILLERMKIFQAIKLGETV